MIERYSHPIVSMLWSDKWTYSAWLEIEQQVLRVQRGHGLVDIDRAAVLIDQLERLVIDDKACESIRGIEVSTKHDVAAFLVWVRAQVDYGQWIHFGLTSSDVVDTAQGMRFNALTPIILSDLDVLINEIRHWTMDPTPLVGRTHGQAAEPTAMRARALHWAHMVAPVVVDLARDIRRLEVAKLSGPVGVFSHNPPRVERDVAMNLGLKPQGQGASQIAPRSSLAGWAANCARLAACCEKITTDVRLMNLMGQASWTKSEGQIGSSAMAQKNNPIYAEQIRGFAQMAAGYSAMLQPLDLWLERDISNSSVERVAVPDLWHVLFNVVQRTGHLLRTMGLDENRLRQDMERNKQDLWTHSATLNAIRGGADWATARDLATRTEVDSIDGDVMADAALFMANYPEARYERD